MSKTCNECLIKLHSNVHSKNSGLFPETMIKWILIRVYILGMVAFLAGCSTTTQAPEPVIDQAATLEFLEPGLRPEVLLFPEYLMMEGFELNQHGRIPQTELVGAGLKTRLSLAIVRSRFMDQLDSNGWKTSKMEIENSSFRLMANHKLEFIEIRAVQGLGPTQVFILFRPEPSDEF
jgi:hypothetical protein